MGVRRSTRDKKAKLLGDEWEIPKEKKKKTFSIECDSFGEVEPSLAMIKKLTSLSKRHQSFRKREDFFVEVKDDILGTTYGCKDCGCLYISKEKMHWHLGRDHSEQIQKIFSRGHS